MNSDVREWFNEGFQKGRREREAEIIELIRRESAGKNIANSWWLQNLIKQFKEEKEQ